MIARSGMVKRRSEAGQTLAFVSLALVTLLAAAGLAVDMGYFRYERRLLQSAADSAALAAATDLNLGQTGQGVAQADALLVAQANGFQDGVNATTVNVTFPGLNPQNAVQVTIQRILPSFFIQVVGANLYTISATGLATIGTSQGCIYALNGDGLGPGLVLNAGIDAPNCGVVDNGPLSGPGDITAASAGVYGSFAGYGGFSTPAVVSIPQPAADPLLYLQPDAPTPSATCIPNLGWATPITLSPGTYCMGITINSGGMVTFNPGLYILGGPLLITGTGTATGVGVTFYVAPGPATFTFNGTGAISLSAPLTVDASFQNVPPGILFFQDPGNTNPADVSESVPGPPGNVMLSGTLYFPTAPLTIAGSATGTNAVVVAYSVTVVTGNVLNSDSPTVPGGSPLQNVSLVD